MLSRQQQLQFCKVCKKRKFSPDQGIICQITEQRAVFKDSCADFERDSHLIQMNQIRREESRKRKLKADFTFGLDKFGIKNGIVAGILLLIAGSTWLIVGLTYGLIYWYPLILILMGITAIIIGIVNGMRRRADRVAKSKENSLDILDD